MPGKHLTPSQKAEALTLRAAGYTITVISDKTGVSVSTLKRLFKDYDVTKGRLKKESIQKATAVLLNDANAIENIKHEVSALVIDDIALVRRLRMAMAEAADKLVAADTAQALQVMRAISSGAVALKSTSETLRKSLGIDKESAVNDDLPELMITIMTDEEIEEVKQAARQRVVGVSDSLVEELSEDDELIDYYDEEAAHAVD